MPIKFLRYVHDDTAPDRTRLTWFDLIELALVALGFLAYFLVRGGVVDREADAIAHAHWIIDMQRALGVAVEPTVNHWTLAARWRIELFNFVYFWFDFPLIVGTGLYLFGRSRRHYTLLRDALLISGAFALVVYWTFPVAPPRFLPDLGFVDTMQKYSELSYQAQSLSPFVNPYAAVPSLHVGWAMLFAIVVAQVWRSVWARTAGVAVMAIQSVAVIGTANHFLFDAVVGVIVTLMALGVAVWLERAGYPAMRELLRRQLVRATEAATPITRRRATPSRSAQVRGVPPGDG